MSEDRNDGFAPIDPKPPEHAEEDPHSDLETRLAVLEALVQHIVDYLSDRNRPEELP
jgi:hypothetical protein